MRTVPWHSAISSSYHTDTECVRAGQIKEKHRRSGTSGKFHCYWCQKLERWRLMRRNRDERLRGVHPAGQS